MRKVITYGTYDLLHRGHIRLLKRARALGDYLIVGVTSDDFDRARGKINVQQPLMERVRAIRETGLADEIIVEEYAGQKIDDIVKHDIDVFTVGSDWRGKFDYLKEYCEVVYLDRTEGVSSSELRAAGHHVKLGLVGESRYIEKFARESAFVDEVGLAGLYTESDDLRSKLQATGVPSFGSFADLLDAVDAVFLMSDPTMHYAQAKQAIEADVHVLCESPVALSTAEYHELRDLAAQRGCILVDALRTAYSMAYERLRLLVKSGHIGKVVSVDATCTSLRPSTSRLALDTETTWNSICTWGTVAMLPVFQILGTGYESKRICSHLVNEELMVDAFTKIDFTFPDAVASVKVGLGAKSEGELVVSGTKGYVYVPAPWWKTDYFELRYENPADNKRYFYQLDGDGIRYQLVSFCRDIEVGRQRSGVPGPVTEAIVGVVEDYFAKRDFTQLAGRGHGSESSAESV